MCVCVCVCVRERERSRAVVECSVTRGEARSHLHSSARAFFFQARERTRGKKRDYLSHSRGE